MIRAIPWLLVAAAVSFPTVLPASPLATDSARIRQIEAFLERKAAFGFSGQVVIARGDRVLLDHAYGAADRAAGVAFTTDTPIGIASMSKAFTAAAILRLEEQGRLDRRAPIGDLLDGVPERWRGITLHQVLAHVAGLPGGYEDDFRAGSLSEALGRLFESTPRPAGTWRYSSEGYNLAAAIAERRSALEWSELLDRMLFTPLAMGHSAPLGRPTRKPVDPAHGYAGWHDRGTPKQWPRNWRVFGGGDLMSSAGDIHRWARALIADPTWARVRDTLWARHAHVDGSAWYGYGAFTDSTPWGTRRIEQAGDTELGFNGALLLYPDEDAEIVVLCNARVPDGRSMRHAVLEDLEQAWVRGDTIALPPHARALTSAERDRVAGSYALGALPAALRVTTDGSLAWLSAEHPDAVEALLGYQGAVQAAVRRGTTRTGTLLGELLARDSLALKRALGSRAAEVAGDYESEWRGLRERHGALVGWQLLGSTLRRGNVRSWARLQWTRGSIVMTWAWADSGRGTLAGSDPGAPEAPLVVSLAAGDRGELLAHDLISGRSWMLAARFTGTDASADPVEIQLARGVTARRRPGAPLGSARD